jgi:hypothetical protein
MFSFIYLFIHSFIIYLFNDTFNRPDHVAMNNRMDSHCLIPDSSYELTATFMSIGSTKPTNQSVLWRFSSGLKITTD